MKCFVSFACALSVLIAVSLAAPLPEESSGVSTNGQAGDLGALGGLGNLLQGIDIPGLLKSASQIIGVIRQFCPQLGEIIDNVVQSVTSQVFRVVGRAILQNGGLTGGGGSGEGRKVNVVLPTFPPDDDEDYDEDEDENTSSAKPEETPKVEEEEKKDGANSLSADVNTNEVITPAVNTTTLYTSAVNENSVDRQARKVRAAETASAPAAAPAVAAEDQDTAASGGNAPLPAEDLSDVDVEDADRNKRYLPFGGGDEHGAGSGNFLFDIIRLIAGSGATEESDEKEHAGGVAEIDVAKGGDHYHEGIPGPITRLFVVANRGLANLVQDLILRLAQTSERIVNFKARLVTSLI